MTVLRANFSGTCVAVRYAMQGRYGNTGRLLAIQIDAAINSGNSGGPAFADIQAGKVAGMCGYACACVLLTHTCTKLCCGVPR
jgi:hypothetical protein